LVNHDAFFLLKKSTESNAPSRLQGFYAPILEFINETNRPDDKNLAPGFESNDRYLIGNPEDPGLIIIPKKG